MKSFMVVILTFSMFFLGTTSSNAQAGHVWRLIKPTKLDDPEKQIAKEQRIKEEKERQEKLQKEFGKIDTKKSSGPELEIKEFKKPICDPNVPKVEENNVPKIKSVPN